MNACRAVTTTEGLSGVETRLVGGLLTRTSLSAVNAHPSWVTDVLCQPDFAEPNPADVGVRTGALRNGTGRFCLIPRGVTTHLL